MSVEMHHLYYLQHFPNNSNHYHHVPNRRFVVTYVVTPLHYFDFLQPDDWTTLEEIFLFHKSYKSIRPFAFVYLPECGLCICDSEWPKGINGLCGGPTTSSSLSSSSSTSFRDRWSKWLGARVLVTCVGFSLSESEPPRCASKACLQQD